MAISTNTRFAVAVHVLTYLAGVGGEGVQPRPISSDELSASVNVTPVHIRRVLGPLREAGLVRSRPGAQGGWAIARSPTSIGLDEVWDLLQGVDPVLGLHEPNPDCPVGRDIQSLLVQLDERAAAAVRAEMAEVTVADVLAAQPAAT